MPSLIYNGGRAARVDLMIRFILFAYQDKVGAAGSGDGPVKAECGKPDLIHAEFYHLMRKNSELLHASERR